MTPNVDSDIFRYLEIVYVISVHKKISKTIFVNCVNYDSKPNYRLYSVN